MLTETHARLRHCCATIVRRRRVPGGNHDVEPAPSADRRSNRPFRPPVDGCRHCGAGTDLPHPGLRAGGPALVLLPRHRRGPGPEADRGPGRQPTSPTKHPGSSLKLEITDLRRGRGRAVDPDRAELAGHRRPSRHRRPRVVQGPVDGPRAVPRARATTSASTTRRRSSSSSRTARRSACRSTSTHRCSGTSATRSRRPASPSRRTSSATKYTMADGTEVEWNYDTLRELAMKLTVDKNGNGRHAGRASTRSKIEQWGFEPQRDVLERHGRVLGRRHARRLRRQDRRHPARPGRTPGSSSTTASGRTTSS